MKLPAYCSVNSNTHNDVSMCYDRVQGLDTLGNVALTTFYVALVVWLPWKPRYEQPRHCTFIS